MLLHDSLCSVPPAQSRGFFVFLPFEAAMCLRRQSVTFMAEELLNLENPAGGAQAEVKYDESSIKHLDDTTHIRTRPGMYIGRLGDGSHADDGIYVLLKETIDNSIDEFKMNATSRFPCATMGAASRSARSWMR